MCRVITLWPGSSNNLFSHHTDTFVSQLARIRYHCVWLSSQTTTYLHSGQVGMSENFRPAQTREFDKVKNKYYYFNHPELYSIDCTQASTKCRFHARISLFQKFIDNLNSYRPCAKRPVLFLTPRSRRRAFELLFCNHNGSFLTIPNLENFMSTRHTS